MIPSPRLVIAAAFAAGAFAAVGVGTFHADAGDGPAGKWTTPPTAAKASPQQKAADPRADRPTDGPAKAATEADVRAALAAPARSDPSGRTFAAFLAGMSTQYGVTARLDPAAFRRLNEDGASPDKFREFDNATIDVRFAESMTLGELLTEVLASLEEGLTYRVRGNHVLIGPTYRTPVLPGGGDPYPVSQIEFPRLMEQLLGPPVSLAVHDQPLTAAVEQLRKLTGANIVIDARQHDKAAGRVSAAFDDVRLLTALKVVGNMCDLKPVALNNVFYLTSAKNAGRLQGEVNREFFGAYGDAVGPPPVPPEPPASAPEPAGKPPAKK